MADQDLVTQPNSGIAKKLQQRGYYINERKEWVHIPNQSLMKILLVNQFVCDFAHSCQCVWIICLITLYQPPKIIDLLILGLPFFISNRIKASLIQYAKRSDQQLWYFLKIIIVAYLCAVFGQYLTIVSTEPQRVIDTLDIWFSYKRLRILILLFGWTLTSVSLETVYTINQQIEAIIIKGQLEYEIAEISKISLISKISAYFLCFISMLKVTTYRKFFCIFSEIQYVCILLCFTGAGIMYNSNNFKVAYKEKKVMNTKKQMLAIQINERILKGYIELYYAPTKLKIYSIVLCCTNIIKFTVRLYCTMWITESFLGEHEMINYKYGIQIGSVMLCLFTLPNYLLREYIRAKWKVWEEKRVKRIYYQVIFIAITILTIVFCIFSVKIENPMIIITSIILCSFLIANLQIFLQNDQEFIGVNVPEFQVCQNSVFRLAHYITLFGIPAFLHLCDLKVNKINAIYFIIGSSVILLLVKFYILAKVQQKKSKENAEEKGNFSEVNVAGHPMGISIRKGKVDDLKSSNLSGLSKSHAQGKWEVKMNL